MGKDAHEGGATICEPPAHGVTREWVRTHEAMQRGYFHRVGARGASGDRVAVIVQCALAPGFYREFFGEGDSREMVSEPAEDLLAWGPVGVLDIG